MRFSKLRHRKICKGLLAKEFRCKCSYESCRAIIINQKLIDAYKTFRLFVEIPLKINSGFRCTQHNFDISGKPLSYHLTGEAIDIDAKELLENYAVSEIIIMAEKAGFKYVKYHSKKKFFHMDTRDDTQG